MKAETATLSLTGESRVQPYWELTKPRITGLVLLTAAAGYYLGTPQALDWLLLAQTLLGTGLVAAGTAVLNQYLERRNDGRMRRTADRPLPSHRLTPAAALTFGATLVLGGVAYLALFTNLLTAILGGLTAGVYLLLYTPLKTRTVFCTTIGAFPGAAPPLMGWAAARGELGWDAWVLFSVLFFWQFPHFLAIAWIYRDDYRRGGFRMLPLVDPEGRKTATQVMVFAALLMITTILVVPAGLAGPWYLAGAIALGTGFMAACVNLARDRSLANGRLVLRVSVIYLPLLLISMVIDKV